MSRDQFQWSLLVKIVSTLKSCLQGTSFLFFSDEIHFQPYDCYVTAVFYLMNRRPQVVVGTHRTRLMMADPHRKWSIRVHQK